jgi:DNA-binding transcriptional LysR family regulator
MLNLHELNVFVEAALAQNFSVAARRLYLSQPAVSLQIANLEKHFGLELFQRNGRTVVLSAAGKVLLPLAQEALQNMKHIEETMSGLKGVMIGDLSIACSTTVGKYILPRLVANFRHKYPNVRVAVNVMSRRAAIEWLLSGRAEIAVVSAKPTHSEVESAPFLEDQVVLIVPPDHPWADGRTVVPEDLLAIPFIMREEVAGTYEVVAEGLVAHGLNINQLQTVLSLANAEAIGMSVEAGIGAAFISRMAATRGIALGRAVEVPVQGLALQRTIYMVRHQRLTATPLQRAFWECAFDPANEAIRRLPEV